MHMHEPARTNVELLRGDMVSYRIVYGPDPVTEKNVRGTARIRMLIASGFLIFAWVVRVLWPEGREVLAAWLLPGEAAVTQAAFLALLDNLRNGFGMADSLTVFCREILYEII